MRAAIYTRVSTKKQADEDKYSLADQEAACRAYIAEQGWTLDEAHVYREVFTGAVIQRPGIDRLREAIAQGQLDRVVVYRFDRFGRDGDDRVYLRVDAKRFGVQYVSTSEPMEDTLEAKLIDYISAYAASWERKAITARTMAGVRARVQSGKPLVGCKAPYGYRYVGEKKERLEVVESEAAVVRRVFEMAAGGQSMRSIAKQLTAEGVPTPNPKRADPTKPLEWRIRTLHLMFKNPVYKGVAVAYRRTSAAPKSGGATKTSTVVRPQDEWVVLPDGTAPAIVSPATWEAVQERVAANRQRSERSKAPKQDAFLRGGFAVCGYCGGPMHVNRTANYSDYRCANIRRHPDCGTGHSIRNYILDAAVWRAVEQFFANPGILRAKLRNAKPVDTAARELEGIAAMRMELDQQQANLTDAIARATNPTTVELLVQKLDGIADQRKALNKRQWDALGRSWEFQDAQRQADDFEAWSRSMRRQLDSLDYDGRREVLHRLGLQVAVFRPGRFEGRYELSIAPDDFTMQDAKDGQRIETAFPTPARGRTDLDQISAMP